MTLIDLENNFFIVKFLLDEDMKYVLTGGPWQIAGQYVTTQRWKPGFDPKEEKITHMTAWVRINGLNVEFFRFDVLERIGNLIGNTVKVDSHTMSQSRGKFARICIELDISKPLTPFIEVEGRTYGVVYEGIHLICFECGCYGHGRDNCPLILKAKARANRADDAENLKDLNAQDNRAAETIILENNPTKKVVGAAVCDPTNVTAKNSSNLLGQWMLLKTKNAKKKTASNLGKVHAEQKKTSASTGSRFSVLDADGNLGGTSVTASTSKPTTFTSTKKSPQLVPHKSDPKKSFNYRNSGMGKQSASARAANPWVSKKPLHDISNTSHLRKDGVRPSPAPRLNRPVDVDAVGVQVQGSDFQDDVQGVFSFNVGVPFSSTVHFDKGPLPQEQNPPDTDIMDIISDGNAPTAHTSVSNGPPSSDFGLSNDLPNANDASAAVQIDRFFCC